MSYNLSSGTREALAYDSLKYAGQEDAYNRFASTEMVLYRLSKSTATLCAGLALLLGYQRAYAIDIMFCAGALLAAIGLTEVSFHRQKEEKKNLWQKGLRWYSGKAGAFSLRTKRQG